MIGIGIFDCDNTYIVYITMYKIVNKKKLKRCRIDIYFPYYID